MRGDVAAARLIGHRLGLHTRRVAPLAVWYALRVVVAFVSLRTSAERDDETCWCHVSSRQEAAKVVQFVLPRV